MSAPIDNENVPPGSCAAHGSAAFVEMTILCPGFWMRFKATPERIDQIMKFILKEATESEIEFAENLKTQPQNAGDKV